MQSDLGLVERIREAARDIRNDGTPSQVGLTDEECETVAAAIERLVAERDEADNALVDKYRDPKTGVFSFPGDVAKIIARLDAAEAQRDKLIEALKFYADSEGWKGRFEQDGPSSIMHHSGPVLIDRGARARQALGDT